MNLFGRREGKSIKDEHEDTEGPVPSSGSYLGFHPWRGGNYGELLSRAAKIKMAFQGDWTGLVVGKKQDGE